MIPVAVLAALLAAPPELRVEGGLPAEAVALAAEAWLAVEALARAEGLRPPEAPRPIRIGVAAALPGGVAAASRPGLVALRPGLPLAGAGADALRHELAHQFLLEACPAAEGDRLFHEAFAIATSGELEGWARAEDGRYLPLARALEDLGRGLDLDAPAARRAVARLLAEAPARPGRLPAVLARRLGACEAGARWTPLRPEALADDRAGAADATVVLSRHTGEVLAAEGAAALPLPFGSTLKPFLVAGATGPLPRLAPGPSAAWRCGDRLPDRVDAATALLRSCNGWFLDWAAAAPGTIGFGAWGPVLAALGLSGPPTGAAEAIGLVPSLRIPALGLARAYRLLAEARPDLVDVLSRNAREGTLAGLEVSGALSGVAVKTGTVLDAAATPRLGWIVAVDRDVVLVMARAGRTPRTFAAEALDRLRRARAPGREAVRVQVFGLLAASDPKGRCAGAGFVLDRARGPIALPDREEPLLARAADGPLLCADGPWLVRLPGAEAPRPYAGVFLHDPAPAARADPRATPREARARRGSDLVFRTDRLAYAAGVVAAEDAGARGEPRVALARVADSNGRHARHLGRPVCDTTHCQVFQGTRRAGREEERALAAPLAGRGWLPFARGGAEAWREARAAAAVEAALAPGARALVFGGGRVSFTSSASDGAERWEERRDLPCEALRGPLKLPSCPERASAAGGTFVFEGRGRGHGEGLDVEWAKRSGLPADRILEAAYGKDRHDPLATSP